MQRNISGEKGPQLPLPSLRLLVPPLRLLSAAIWQTVQQRVVMDYGMLEEFVTMATQIVPELLNHRQRAQLTLGLQTQLVLELCRSESTADLKTIQPHLDRMQTPQGVDEDIELSTSNFLSLIQTLLEDPEERQRFFQDVFPVKFCPKYETAIPKLMWHFLSRLEKLLPVPDIQQAASLLSDVPSVLEECVESVSHSQQLKTLLQYHRDLGQLDSDDTQFLTDGDCILSALNLSTVESEMIANEQTETETLTDYMDSFSEKVVKSITLTEDTEIELGAEETMERGTEEWEKNCKQSFVSNDEGAEMIDDDDDDDFADPVEHVVHMVDMDEETVVLDQSALQVQTGNEEGDNNVEIVPKGLETVEEEVEPVNEIVMAIGEDGRVEPMDKVMASDDRGERRQSSESVEIKDDRDETSGISNTRGQSITLPNVIISSVIHKPTVQLIRLDCPIVTLPLRPVKAIKMEYYSGPQGTSTCKTCPTCGKTFSRGADMRRHQRTHTGERPYQCAQCRKRFQYQSDLRRHQQNVCKVDVSEPTDKSPKKSEDKESVQNNLSPVEKHSDAKTDQQSTCEAEVSEPKTQTSSSPKEFADEGQSHNDKGHLDNLTCNVCCKTVLHPSDMKKHMKVHSEERPHCCFTCEKSYKDASSLKRHTERCGKVSTVRQSNPPASDENNQETSSKTVDKPLSEGGNLESSSGAELETESEDSDSPPTSVSQDPSYTPEPSETKKKKLAKVCRVCGLQVRGSMTYHLRSHSEERLFTCPNCGVGFKFKNDLRRHMIKVCKVRIIEAEALKERDKTVKCDECDKEFKFTSILRAHKLTHNPLYCTECKRVFPDSEMLTRHNVKHKPLQCNMCEKSFKGVKHLNKHYRDDHEFSGPFICSQCEKSYTDLPAFIRHERTHTGELPFQCSHCPKGFHFSYALTTHERTHTKESPFLCWECGKSFKANVALNKHILCCHSSTAEKRFSCSQCGKAYGLKRTLELHVQKQHAGVRYPCTYCGKLFLSASSLVRHDLIHTQERPYPCKVCGKSFKSASELKIHTRYHTGERPFKCKDCGKGFVQSYYLTLHQRTHSGEKPCVCPVCEKSFRSHDLLKRHKRIHTGEKPYQCLLCGAAFNRAELLKAHERKSH